MSVNESKKWTLFFLITVIFIDFMGMATVVVIFPKLLLESNFIFSVAMSDSQRLWWMGVLLAIYPFGQIVGASVFGKLSDYYGRKKLLVSTLLGTLVGFILSGFAIEMSLPIVLFASRLLAGLCAGNVAIAQASLSDISNEKTKTKYIALGQTAMGSAYIVGPILGAILSESTTVSWFNSATPFWFFSLLLALLTLATASLYKETLVQPKREKIVLLGGLKQIYSALTDSRLGGAFLVWLIFVSGWWLFESFMPAFLLQNFHFSTVQIGNVLSFNGALYAGFQFLVVQRVAQYIKPESMIKYSGCFVAFSIISLAYVGSTLELYMAMSVFVMSMGFMIPGLISYISSQASDNEQGQVMGMVNSIQAVSTVIVMMLGGYLNAINNGITILGGGLLVLFSWLLFIGLVGKKTQRSVYAADA